MTKFSSTSSWNSIVALPAYLLWTGTTAKRGPCVPAWNRWGWLGCVAFFVVAQAVAGALVFFFWRGMPSAGASKPRSQEVRLTR
ncbi:hypothetical protein BCEN4_350117 [Burkholderia cenocepacia]|nr:hypothetical protein BCEN4_350117 [Burkholderia cenocepacia]